LLSTCRAFAASDECGCEGEECEGFHLTATNFHWAEWVD
jgi:hypothetical protein